MCRTFSRLDETVTCNTRPGFALRSAFNNKTMNRFPLSINFIEIKKLKINIW